MIFERFSLDKIAKLLKNFLGTLPSKVSITQLAGGSTDTIMAKAIINDNCYVVRIFDSLINKEQRIKEILAQQLAADHNIAPKVYYSPSDYEGMIMACVEGQTLKLAQTKQPETIRAIAEVLGILHKISAKFLPIYDIDTRIEQKASNIQKELGKKYILLDEALYFFRQLKQRTEIHPKKYVFCHGDLNPTNIFLHNDRIILIDWADAKQCEPFIDIAIVAMLTAMDSDKTQLLLCEYLQQLPTPEQQVTFYTMQKKIYLDFALNLLEQLIHTKFLHVFKEKSSDKPLNTLLYEEEFLFNEKLRDIPPEFTYAMATSALHEMLKEKN